MNSKSGDQPPEPSRDPGNQPAGSSRFPTGWNDIVAFELGLEEVVPGAPAAKDEQFDTQAERKDYDGPDANWVTNPPKDICGLALSGGGIRSATFNLGLLQGLNRFGILGFFDYLSTVSGGGYIGGFWTAWRSRPENAGGGVFPQLDGRAGASENGRPGAEAPEIRHLREFSNFLVPRLGLFSVDTGRIVISVLGAIIPSLIVSVCVLAVVLLFYQIIAAFLVDGAIFGQNQVPHLPAVAVLFLTAAVLVVTEITWRERLTGAQQWSYRGTGLLSIGLVLLCWHYLPAFIDLSPDLLLPAVWAVTTVTLVVTTWLFSRLILNFHLQTAKASVKRVGSRFLYAAGVWTVVFGIWWTAEFVHGQLAAQPSIAALFASALAALSGFFARIQLLLGRKSNKPQEESLGSRLRPYVPQVLAYAAVGIMFVMVGVLLIALAGTLDVAFAREGEPIFRIGPRDYFVPAALVSALAVILFAALTMDPNRVGLHSFYRSRIARAYLGASLPVNGESGNIPANHPPRRAARTARYVEEQKHDDIRLSDCTSARPFHLVCCTANDLASKDAMASLYRGATSAVLSPKAFSVDRVWAAWDTLKFKSPSLGASLTASAAALNSHMGSMSMRLGPAVRFLMTALNLRLGMWWPSPTSRGRSVVRQVMPGWAFIKEMLGFSSATGKEVLLSDGGHFENMALYELIRRHCRYIVVSDCGMDAEVLFDDFGNLVRRVRADFGADIRIDLSPLKPGENGLARQAMVAGDIHYPTGDSGILLFFKPTLVGSEPADVIQYRSRNAQFPHESTGDQFYDEAQWESYRRLGEHSAEMALGSIIQKLSGGDAEERKRKLFMQARREWLPIPSGYADRVSHFASRASELDAKLLGSECKTLLAEVFKEIPEVGRQVWDHLGAGEEGEPVPSEKDDTEDDSRQAKMLDPEELGPSLHMIRRAIHFMEEFYLHENLEHNHNHPLYLGMMNYFARWAFAPTFRMWWPIVKSMYPQQFTRFLEAHFGLKPVEPVSTVHLAKTVRGFASVCRDDARQLKKNEAIARYCLHLRYRNIATDINAASLVFSRQNSLVAWTIEDFCVPPGLWGMGIGDDFLSHLKRKVSYHQDDGDIQPEVNVILVAIPLTESADPAALKTQSNEIYFYRSAGFEETTELEAAMLLDAHGMRDLFGDNRRRLKWMRYETG